MALSAKAGAQQAPTCPPGEPVSWQSQTAYDDAQVAVPDASVQVPIAQYEIRQGRNIAFAAFCMAWGAGAAAGMVPAVVQMSVSRDDAGALILPSFQGAWALTNATLVIIDADTVELRADNVSGETVEVRVRAVFNELHLQALAL
jgi:hypothetical protein